MKTILAVIGVMALIVVIVIGGGVYYGYHHSSAMIAQGAQTEIDRFINTRHPPEGVASDMRRIVNGCKLHSSFACTMFLANTMQMTRQTTFSAADTQILDEAARLAEQESVSQNEIRAFLAKTKAAHPSASGSVPLQPVTQ